MLDQEVGIAERGFELSLCSSMETQMSSPPFRTVGPTRAGRRGVEGQEV